MGVHKPEKKFRIRQIIKRWLRQIIKRWRSLFKRRLSSATFICITGSSGKSSTTVMLSHILSGVAPVSTQAFTNTYRPYVKLLGKLPSSQSYVICEIGADGPGRLRQMITLLRPSVGIVTLVGLEHYSAFRTREAVAQEKGTLVEALPKDGLAILNRDDPLVLAMTSRTRARVVTFGVSDGPYQITGALAPAPGKLVVTIAHGGESVDIDTRLTGSHNSLAVAAAFACAHELGAPVPLIKEQLESLQSVFGRCSAHFINNGPIFIADTGKAPYYSIYLPIKMMEAFKAPRKRILIGQISDAGNTNPKYRDVYRACREVADQVIFVGDNAHRSKATAEEIAAQKFVEMRSVEDAARFVKETAVPGEIILLKSAPNLHLERVLMSFGDEVRCWEQDCGKRVNCIDCGLYAVPFPQHKQIRENERQLRRALQATGAGASGATSRFP
jgi:UDP-N-acetylmuramoyl-tripeptide--D-alanyl-D-alanine ligase